MYLRKVFLHQKKTDIIEPFSFIVDWISSLVLYKKNHYTINQDEEWPLFLVEYDTLSVPFQT